MLASFFLVAALNAAPAVRTEPAHAPSKQQLAHAKREWREMRERAEAQRHHKRFDQPKEAQQFFLEQRLPPGASELDPRWYEAAEAHARTMERFSTSSNSRLPATRAGLADWTARGPGNIGGRTRALAFSTTFATDNTMYAAGVAGGLWRSTNGGTSWSPIGDFLANIAITTLTVDRPSGAPADRIIIGTGEGFLNVDAVRGNGIYVSTDAGTSFTALANTVNQANFRVVNDLIVGRTNSQNFYAATGTGIMRSVDGGANWTQVLNRSTNRGCFDLEQRTDQATDTVFGACGSFGATAGDIVRNTDAGGAGSWTTIRTETNQGRTTLAIAPSAQGTMYALVSSQSGTGSMANGGLLAVIRTTDNLAATPTWTDQRRPSPTVTLAAAQLGDVLLTNPVFVKLGTCGFGAGAGFNNQGWYDNILKVDPTNANRIWAGGIDLFRSDNAGVDWGVASYWWFDPAADPQYVHADNHGLFFHPSYNGTTNTTLYATNDGGIQRTTNATAAVGTNTTNTASNSSCGVNLPAVTWASLNGNYQITQFYHGTVFNNAGTTTYFGGTQDNGTLEGTTAGLNFTEINGGDGGYTAHYFNGTNRYRIAANTGMSFQRRINNGAFAAMQTGITGTGLFISPLTQSLIAGQRLYAGGQRLLRLPDLTAATPTWASASTTFASAAQLSAVATAPNLTGGAEMIAIGTTSGNVCTIADGLTSGGATAFANGCVALGGNVSSVVFDPTQPAGTANNARIIYATVSTFGSNQVQRSTDGGATWSALDNTGRLGLPDAPVHSIVVDPYYEAPSHRLYVGTDIGIFVSLRCDTTLAASATNCVWLRENTSFANVPTEWLTLSDPGFGRDLRAGSQNRSLAAFTHGRSVFTTVTRGAVRTCIAGTALNNGSTTDFDFSLGGTGNLIDVDLDMDLTHTEVDDLSITLSKLGSGVTRTAMNHTASSCTQDNVVALFDDDADQTADSTCVVATPTISGRFRPTQSFSNFNGLAHAGTWRVSITDAAAGGSGTLNQVCLTTTVNRDATTPVQFSQISSRRIGDEIEVQFETAANIGSLAFRLAHDSAQRAPTSWISAAADTHKTQRYVMRQRWAEGEFRIVTLESNGDERSEGMFAVGKSYGGPDALDDQAIQWAPIRAARDSAIQQRNLGARADQLWLDIAESGVHEIAGTQILASAPELSGRAIEELALTRNGTPVAIEIESADAIFDASDLIRFIGVARTRPSEQVDANASLYGANQSYLLLANAAQALRISAKDASVNVAQARLERYQQTLSFEQNKLYTPLADAADPWVWLRVLSLNGQSASEPISFDLPELPQADSTLRLSLLGGIAYAGNEPDHHVEILLNDELLGSTRFDGLGIKQLSFELTPAQLRTGENILRLHLPGDTGFSADAVYLEDFSLTGSFTIDHASTRAGLALSVGAKQLAPDTLSRNGFEVGACAQCPAVRIAGLTAGAHVYRQLGSVVERLHGGAMIQGAREMSLGQLQGVLWSEERTTMRQPSTRPVSAESLPTGSANYLVIAHPQFAGALDAFLATKRAQGLSAQVVSTDTIYAHYSGGNLDASAIQRFLTENAAKLGVRFVLLVGGDSYDYFGDLGNGSFSHLPTLYRRAGEFVRFAPTDALYGFDVQGVPTIAVGRLPARTLEELSAMLASVAAQSSNTGQHALMVADQDDDARFSYASDQLAKLLPANATVTQVKLDEMDVQGARTTLQGATTSNGVRLIHFNGHSGPSRWSTNGLLSAQDVRGNFFSGMSNKPIVVQWGCWNTWFVDPSRNTMGHAWLSANSGAGAVIGASTLIEAHHADALAYAFIPELSAGGSIGEALNRAKRTLMQTAPQATDALYGINILGDPAARY